MHMQPGGGVYSWGEILPAPLSEQIPSDLGRAKLQQLSACGGTVCKHSGRHCEHFTPCSAGAWHLGHTGSALRYSQAPLYVTLLAELPASHLGWGTLPATQGRSAREQPCPPEGTSGGLFLPVWFWLGDFCLGFWFFSPRSLYFDMCSDQSKSWWTAFI